MNVHTTMSSNLERVPASLRSWLSQPRPMLINGKWVQAKSGKVIDVLDPSNEMPLATVAEGDAADIDDAVRAARRALEQGPWGRLTPSARGRIVHKIGDLIYENLDELAQLESLDNGKPFSVARVADVPLSADIFHYMSGWSTKLEGKHIPISHLVSPGEYLSFTRLEPIGVVGQIIPWNFPLLMAAWKLAPALACGCTVVLKVAEETPLSALRLGELLLEAGVPEGVVNIVPGYGETAGAALAAHPDVDKVAFTGSTEVGKAIARAVAGTDKRVTLELGGKAANIVFDDAPLDQAVEGIVNGIYFNQGEVCCAGSRLLAQESIVEPLIEKLKDRLSTIRVGDPLDKNTDVGAINSRAQLEKITELVAAGRAEGAEMYQPACDLPDRGYFFRPTLFTNVAQSHRIAREEIFGPVLSVLTFRTPEEAVEKANNTPYGLSAGIWTDKGSRILFMVKRMKAGVVWANTFNRFDPTSPFGGYKESGFGREGGMHGLHAYVRLEDR